jgi:hypothetical protein
MHYLILQVQQQLEDGDSATAAVAAPYSQQHCHTQYLKYLINHQLLLFLISTTAYANLNNLGTGTT